MKTVNKDDVLSMRVLGDSIRLEVDLPEKPRDQEAGGKRTDSPPTRAETLIRRRRVSSATSRKPAAVTGRRPPQSSQPCRSRSASEPSGPKTVIIGRRPITSHSGGNDAQQLVRLADDRRPDAPNKVFEAVERALAAPGGPSAGAAEGRVRGPAGIRGRLSQPERGEPPLPADRAARRPARRRPPRRDADGARAEPRHPPACSRPGRRDLAGDPGALDELQDRSARTGRR